MLAPGQEPNEMMAAIHRDVVESAGVVIAKKGCTNWAVGLTGAYIGNAVLDDTRQIMPLSTCVRGMHGITEDVLSVPCSVGSHGVRRVIDMPLTQSEIDGFLKSAETVWKVQEGIWDKLW
jgi:L-lactate dehydrogenase